MNYGVIECSINCPKCDSPVMLNGPLEKAHCERCQSDTDVPHEYWKDILENILEEVKNELKEGEGSNSNIFGMFKTTLLYGRLKPRCEECKTYFEVNEGLSEAYVHKCSECGCSIEISPCPSWLKKIHPAIKLLVNADLKSSSGKEPPAISGPIVFSCPKCGGALTIDGMDRLVPCEYCGVNVYLPDDLWLRLHPAKTKERWFIGFE